MRIKCPTCAATYDVPDQMLESGRKVRCSKCGQQWVASAAAPPAARQAPSPVPAIPPPPLAAPEATVAAPPRIAAPVPPPAPPPPTPMPAPMRVAALAEGGPAAPNPEPQPAAAIAAEERSAAARHPLFALVDDDAAPRSDRAANVPAAERPPSSVWDKLTEQPPRPTPMPLTQPEAAVVVAPPATPARRRGGSAMVWLGWLMSLVIWGFVAWAAFAWRHQLMAAWPPIQRLYAAFGVGPGP